MMQKGVEFEIDFPFFRCKSTTLFANLQSFCNENANNLFFFQNQPIRPSYSSKSTLCLIDRF